MKKRGLFFTAFICCLMAQHAFAQRFDYEKIAPHPRIILLEGEEESVKEALAGWDL